MFIYYFQRNNMTPSSSILISVVIPVYNVEKYLRECLDSIINQTFKDIEILCVNDGSTDSSAAILSEYAEKDKRIIVINQENRGAGSARNNAIERSRGRYLYFIDADDTADPELLRLAFISSEYYECDMLFFDIIPYDERADLEQVKCMPKYWFSLEKWNPTKGVDDSSAFLHNCWPPMKLIRASFLKNNNLRFPENIRCSEDLLFHWQAMLKSPRVSVLPIHLYFYRERSGSLFHSTASKGDILKCYAAIREELDQHKQYDQYRSIYIWQKMFDFFRLVYLTSPSSQHSAVKKQIIENMNEDDWKYVKSDPMIQRYPYIRNFFLALQGDWKAKIKFLLYLNFKERPRAFLSYWGAGILKSKIHYYFAKKFSAKHVKRNRELVNAISLFQEEALKDRKQTEQNEQ